jgi:hypothetical protein
VAAFEYWLCLWLQQNDTAPHCSSSARYSYRYRNKKCRDIKDINMFYFSRRRTAYATPSINGAAVSVAILLSGRGFHVLFIFWRHFLESGPPFLINIFVATLEQVVLGNFSHHKE